MKKILYLDLESTGLDPEKHGIISLAMLVEIDGELVDELYLECCPTGRIADDRALEVNGYTREQIASFTPWENQKFLVDGFLQKYVDKFNREDKFIIAGQNVRFDLEFLMSYFKFCGDNYLGSYIKLGPSIDTLPILTFLQDIGKVPVLKNSKLGTMCEYFGIGLENAHNSLADIKATREVYLKMRELCNGI